MNNKALLLPILLLLAVSAASAQCLPGQLDICKACNTTSDCCQVPGKGPCGCIQNMVPGAPDPKVCMCQSNSLMDCINANVASAQAAKANALAANGTAQTVQPAPKCVKVPKGIQRKVPCEEPTTSTTKADTKP